MGGAPLNFAAHLAKCGWESYMFSSVGKDELGSQALLRIASLGIKSDFIQIHTSLPTGTVKVVIKDGQPDYVINENVAYDFIDYDDQRKFLNERDFDVLYFGTLAQRNVHSAATLKALVAENQFKHIFYDVNLRKNGYSKDVIDASLQICSILKLNDEEVQIVAEMFYRKGMEQEAFFKQISVDYQIEIIIVTAGAKGCYIYQSGTFTFIEGLSVKVIDTIGAGDAFSAAFVHQYLKHSDIRRAGEVANKLGAFVAGSRGAIPEYSVEIREVLLLKSEK